MNLYVVSCGLYQYFKVAKSEDDAVEKVCKLNNLKHLPFKAEIIDLEGYKLVVEEALKEPVKEVINCEVKKDSKKKI